VYSKSHCPYCTSTKSLFSQKFPNVTVNVVELNKTSDGSAIQSTLLGMTGQRTVPSVWVNGKHIGGNDDTQAAFRSGSLQEMLRE